MKIFLAGGTGFFGGHLRMSLLDAGHEIRLLTHKRSGVPEERIEQVEGDVTDLDSFADRVRGCDAVINLVGIIR